MRNLLSRINAFLLDVLDNRQLIKLGRVVVSVDYYARNPGLGVDLFIGNYDVSVCIALTVFSLNFSYLRVSGRK